MYSIERGFEKQPDSEYYNFMIDYGFTAEAFVPGLTSIRIHQGQSKKQMIGSILLPLGTATALTAWLTGQTYVSTSSAIFTAVTGSTPGAVLTPMAGITAAVVLGNELQTTLHSNLGMQEIPGSGGGYTNPMGGSGETYYPFKGLVDYFKG